MKESWTTNGRPCERSNRITIEVLGRDAQKAMDEGRVGRWATVEGYIRSEEYQGRTLIKVRTLNIEIWDYAQDASTTEGNTIRKDGKASSRADGVPIGHPFAERGDIRKEPS